MSFVARTSAIDGDVTFIIAVDDTSLRWLSDYLRTSHVGQHFTIGDGKPIASDERCVIDVKIESPGFKAKFTQTSEVNCSWSINEIVSDGYADMVDGMLNFTGACHQYLDGESTDVPTFVITKGEYAADSLRKMREA